MCRISDREVKDLKAKFVAQHGHFVLPTGYTGHVHAFQPVATGIQLCGLCGAEHICFRGKCPEAPNDAGELVCTITGCVTTPYNLCNERDVHQRTSPAAKPSRRQRHSTRQVPGSIQRVHVENLYNTVTRIVHELLNSETTKKCMIEEEQRANLKVGVVLGRILREMNTTLGANVRIDLVKVETTLAYTFRRLRDGRAIANARKNITAIMKMCVQSIVSIIDQHGWYRTSRQLTHVPRGKGQSGCTIAYVSEY